MGHRVGHTLNLELIPKHYGFDVGILSKYLGIIRISCIDNIGSWNYHKEEFHYVFHVFGQILSKLRQLSRNAATIRIDTLSELGDTPI